MACHRWNCGRPCGVAGNDGWGRGQWGAGRGSGVRGEGGSREEGRRLSGRQEQRYERCPYMHTP